MNPIFVINIKKLITSHIASFEIPKKTFLVIILMLSNVVARGVVKEVAVFKIVLLLLKILIYT